MSYLAAYSAEQQAAAGGPRGSGTPPSIALLAPRLAPRSQLPCTALEAATGLLPDGPSRSGGAGSAVSSSAFVPLRPSYVATCYSLLHELDVVEAAVRRRPELWEAPTLGALQQALWGALDATASHGGGGQEAGAG